MAESGESECQYSYTATKEYLRAVVYPDGYDKQSKHGLHFGGWPSHVESKEDSKAGD